MMRRVRTFLTLFSYFLLHLDLVGSASAPADASLCFEACQKSFAALHFVDVNATEPPQSQECTSSLNIQALYLCARVHCHRKARAAGLDALNQTCRKVTGSPVPPFSLVANYTMGDLAGLRKFNATYPTPDVPVSEVVLPTSAFFELWLRTLDAVEYVYWYHFSYGWIMAWYWIAVVAIGMATRAFRYLETTRRRVPSTQSSVWLWLKRNINTPATLGRRCAQDYGGWCTIPPMIQSLTIALFILINIACSVHGYKIFPGNIYFPSETKQVLRYLSDRTGIMSFANFPMVWLFGMRNNLAIWLTGWDFGTYNSFHRWIARVATVQAVVHSVGYTVIILREGGWKYFAWWWTKLFWWAGELATVFMCAILAFSVFWLRRQQYEVFLAVHIGLSILVLVTMLGHVSIFDGEYDPMVWIPVLIWLLDRVLRVGRILAFRMRFWETEAKVTFNPATNMTRLEVPCSMSMYTVCPGTFFYLMVLDGSNFWESHPFTVASVSNPADGDIDMLLNEEAPLLEREENLPLEPERKEHRSGKGYTMAFLIRPYDSFTSRLRGMAESEWPKSASVCLAVEGPYGRTLPLHLFDHVLFVVGGSGIVVPLSYMRHLTASSTRPRSVHVHWAVRQPALAEEVLSRDLKEALECEEIGVSIYLTAADGHRVNISQSRTRWRRRRLDAAATVAAAVDDMTGGSLAVVACGPARMADDARRATVDAMGSTRDRIEYFEESFQW